jgi:hypothetical protein
MDLCEKIKQSQYKYYQYTIQCIDAYLDNDVEPLQKFLSNLLKLDKGQIVLGDDFNILVDAYKTHDTSHLNYLRHKFDVALKMNF